MAPITLLKPFQHNHKAINVQFFFHWLDYFLLDFDITNHPTTITATLTIINTIHIVTSAIMIIVMRSRSTYKKKISTVIWDNSRFVRRVHNYMNTRINSWCWIILNVRKFTRFNNAHFNKKITCFICVFIMMIMKWVPWGWVWSETVCEGNLTREWFHNIIHEFTLFWRFLCQNKQNSQFRTRCIFEGVDWSVSLYFWLFFSWYSYIFVHECELNDFKFN